MATLRRGAGADSQGASGSSGGFADGAGECEGEGGMKEQLPVQAPNIIDRLRFLSRTHRGKGDYTAEREQLFKGETVESIIAEIKARRINNKAK